MPDSHSSPSAHHTPAERAPREAVPADCEALQTDALARRMLESIPAPAMVLNPQRQVLAVNQRFLDAAGLADAAPLLGQRPGELLGCVHADTAPGGCGTSEHCSVCGAVSAILECQQSGQASVSECRMRTLNAADGGAIEVEVQATPIVVGDLELVVVSLRDISSEKRRAVLERTFFHDVLNAVSGLRAVAELLLDGDDPEAEAEYRQVIHQLAVQIGDEIAAQRQLLAAERGELVPDLHIMRVRDVVEPVVETYRRHTVAGRRQLVLADCPHVELETDPVLLRRVLGNLVKNALEATPRGGEVTVSVEVQGDAVTFSVVNPGVMPDHVKRQVFQRSFSTRGDEGRGIGTHSVKLLTERYLGGAVAFVSEEPLGTVFTVTLPLRKAPAA